ncbi:MAG: zf-HC2 domain-containing protein [Planctomycetota bacterium]|jgi:hypothetical protein
MGDCEQFAEMLSAWLDDELEADEQAALEAHLADCPACRALKRRFQAVDELATKSETLTDSGIAGRRTSGQPAPWLGMSLRRAASIAAAALILIAVSLFILATGDRSEARRAATENLAALNAMNQEAYKDQDAVLKSLEWDLNAMKLTVRCSELDEKSAEALLGRIDQLLEEVDNTRSKKPEDIGELGEEP